MNPYQVHQASYELNHYLLNNPGVSLPLTGAAATNWTTVFDGIKSAPVNRSRYKSHEEWRTTFVAVDDGRTIPPATGTDSTITNTADAITEQNGISPLPTGLTISTSGTAFNVAEYFYEKGIENGKKQGWHDTFKAIWDGAIDQVQVAVEQALRYPDMSGIEISQPLPMTRLVTHTVAAVTKLTTAVQLGSPNASLHLMWGTMSELAAASAQSSATLIRLVSGSGILTASPASISNDPGEAASSSSGGMTASKVITIAATLTAASASLSSNAGLLRTSISANLTAGSASLTATGTIHRQSISANLTAGSASLTVTVNSL